jgi:hypothetical protein
MAQEDGQNFFEGKWGVCTTVVYILYTISVFFFETTIIQIIDHHSHSCPHFTEMPPQCSANKVTTEKTAAVSEAMPQQACKNV